MWVNTFPNSTVPPDYDPFKQAFTLVGSDGVPFNATMEYVDWLRGYGTRLGIIYGSQIGASFMLFAILLLLTRRDKRRSAIFIMNALCLVTNFIKLILQSLFLTGNYFNVYSQVSGDTSRDQWQDRANTITANTLSLLLYIFIVISLSLQVWVVCKTASTIQRITIMIVTTAFALVATGYRFAVTVISNIITMNPAGGTMRGYTRLLDLMVIFQAVAIWMYCAVFTTKLGYALVQRRKLGMTQFGPMQIVFIMGAQTMVVPGMYSALCPRSHIVLTLSAAIFSVLQFYKGVPEFGSLTFTVVCIFLPLSAIWAGIVANDRQIASSGASGHRRLLHAYFGRPDASSNGSNTALNSTTVNSCHKEPVSPASTSAPSKPRHSDDDAIHVDHEWSVENEKGESSSPRYSRYAANAQRDV
jgi:pheromone alpha factor receptor